MCTKSSGKTGNFDFFGPNLPQNEFWGRNFEVLSPDLESAAPIYHEFFDLNFGKLPNYVRYFGSYNVEGVAKSWWRWMEVDGAGWSWVHGLVIPKSQCNFYHFKIRLNDYNNNGKCPLSENKKNQIQFFV